ncbi:MAG: hypothetical protein GXP16_10475 [Gammaproteobacteria bacterium]|nr:hypothetical protein [Gammaproteobacteria bacterium]
MYIRSIFCVGTLLISTLYPVQVTAKENGLTAWGHPNLSGTFDVSTLTPLQRPKEFGDSLELTPEQAEEIVTKNQQRIADRDKNRGPATQAPPSGGASPVGTGDEFRETSGAGNVGGYNNFWIDQGEDVFTVDGKFRTSIIYDPKNGRLPAPTEAAMKRFAERRKLRRPNDGSAWWLDIEGPGPYDGPEMLGISERCIVGFTGATPTFPSLYNNYKRIVQSEHHVMILIEMVHDARIIRLNAEHQPASLRSYLGDSIGWWEGNTLVVDTTNFRADSGQARGGSENMHVVEHFTRTDDGDLLYQLTVEDDTVWTAPWSGEYMWRASTEKVYEYACHEGNYSMGGILRGARLLESEHVSPQSSGQD